MQVVKHMQGASGASAPSAVEKLSAQVQQLRSDDHQQRAMIEQQRAIVEQQRPGSAISNSSMLDYWCALTPSS